MFLTLLSSLLLGTPADVIYPRTPVIADRPYNVVAEIVVPSEAAVPVKGTVEITLDGIPVRAVRSARLMGTGTVSPVYSRTKSSVFQTHYNRWAGGWSTWHDPRHARELCRVRPRSNTVTLPFSVDLVAAVNHFYISLEIASRHADLAAPFSCTVKSIRLADGGEVPFKAVGDGVRRLGLALRTHGDDGSDSYRIPGLARTPKGTLVAVYDIRRDSGNDLNCDIDVGVSRSTDGGRHWEKMRVAMDMGEYGGLPQAQNGVGDPCVLVDERTGDIFIAAIWGHGLEGGAAIFNSKTGMDPIRVAQMVLVKSTDDGRTWSKPVNITSQVKDPAWATCLGGPGNGITMQDGTLVFPFQWWDKDHIGSSGIIYSRDHGATWHFEGTATRNVCEDQVVELEPGTLMLNMRNYGNNDRLRKVFVTKDLGKTWTAHPSNGMLPEPVCQASLVKFPAARNSYGKDILLFSNPDSRKARVRMTVKASLDHGMTWPYKLLLDEEPGWGYSCLCPIDAETVGILYEGSAAQLVFQVIRLSDILGGAN